MTYKQIEIEIENMGDWNTVISRVRTKSVELGMCGFVHVRERERERKNERMRERERERERNEFINENNFIFNR